jgi:hypothetical protein
VAHDTVAPEDRAVVAAVGSADLGAVGDRPLDRRRSIQGERPHQCGVDAEPVESREVLQVVLRLEYDHAGPRLACGDRGSQAGDATTHHDDFEIGVHGDLLGWVGDSMSRPPATRLDS